MDDQQPPLLSWLKGLKEGWALYTALGSFALYLLGYLALRFHLTAFGVGTDLAVVDERYFFTGARFAVYLISTVPSVVLLGLAVALPVSLLLKLASVRRLLQRLGNWWSSPTRLALAGVILSVALIQFVMRKCFSFNNLLLRRELPRHPAWFEDLLLDSSGAFLALYFIGVIASIALTVGLWILARRMAQQTLFSTICTHLLAFLIAVECLFLPVNYGYLVVDKTVPRVTDLGGQLLLRPGQQAWLVWEGDQGNTFLTRDISGGDDQRALVTLPRQKTEKIEIVGQDAILRLLFEQRTQQSERPAPKPD